jgi:hypothetical protein
MHSCYNKLNSLFDTDENLHIIIIDRPLRLYLKSNYIDIRDQPFHFKWMVSYDFPPCQNFFFTQNKNQNVSFLDMEDQ